MADQWAVPMVLALSTVAAVSMAVVEAMAAVDTGN